MALAVAHAVDIAFQCIVVGDGYAGGKLLVAMHIAIPVEAAPLGVAGMVHQMLQHAALHGFGIGGILVYRVLAAP